MKRIVLKITPQTNVRTTQRDVVVFRIPEECPEQCGQPRRHSKAPMIEVLKRGKLVMVHAGCKHSLSEEGLKRKNRIVKYNQYKQDLVDVAFDAGFDLPDFGATINFFIPVPPSWSKKKKKAMHHTMHQPKPDLDNLLKALQDALRKVDSSIGHYAGLGKWWLNEPTGYIEIIMTAQNTPPVYRSVETDELR